ncbi:MAG: D-methionine transport system permease protein [Microbacteriaceae bacterium]|nr:ABC-type metal ion transport system, permease component [Leifsonia sp.]MDQ1581243.1 D-methionine transport system permease protein [Microbacteriaceae bacterium]MDQ1588032.1 D-methionine transport system permease protein [Microbacteriaceae bacterium]
MNADWTLLGPVLVQALGETLWAVSITMVLGGIFGFVIGTMLYTTRRGNILANAAVYNVLNVLINIVRPIPFIVFIAFIQPVTLGLIGTSIGVPAIIVPMTIAASFAIGRIVEQNLVTIDPGVIEAARAMGASPLRIISTILVPEALGPLILGYTFIFVGVVDMSALAGLIGGGGLGNFAILYGYQRFNYGVTLVAVVVIIVIVQLGQFLGNWLARKALRR